MSSSSAALLSPSSNNSLKERAATTTASLSAASPRAGAIRNKKLLSSAPSFKQDTDDNPAAKPATLPLNSSTSSSKVEDDESSSRSLKKGTSSVGSGGSVQNPYTAGTTSSLLPVISSIVQRLAEARTAPVRCHQKHVFALIPAVLVIFFLTMNIFVLHHYELTDKRLRQRHKGHDDYVQPLSEEDKANLLRIEQRKRERRKKREQEERRAKWYQKNKVQEKKIVMPVNTSMAPDAIFSACLLIKDDNDLLNEWIAYHYFALQLRTLLVAVDPKSQQSPKELFAKWRNLTGDFTIVEWTDKHYMPVSFLETGRPPQKFMMTESNFSFPGNISFPLTNQSLLEISVHRYRQRVFLAKCMKQLKSMPGVGWMMHIDTDEFVMPSKLFRQMSPDYVDTKQMDQPGSVLHLIQQVVKKTHELVNYPCLALLRVLFGSVESSNPKQEMFAYMPSNGPVQYDPTKFETIRWRFHALPHDMSLHGNPKVIMDLAAMKESSLPNDVAFSIHRPVMKYCRRNTDTSFTSFRKQPIAANHYVGSWERYNARADQRRSRAVYDKKAKHQRAKDDGIKPWLQGFVNQVGPERAAALFGKEYWL